MSEFFWESTQKARKEHFCDACCNWIQPGDVYSRKIWNPRRTRYFHVMREHDTPRCPPNESEAIALEMMQEECVALGVPIAIEIRTKEVVLVQIDGSTIIHHELEMVTVAVSPTTIPDEDASDDEVPF